MKVELIDEPLLEFGDSKKHVDIKYGISRFGTLDCKNSSAPRQIKLGIIGTSETIEGLANWLLKCQNEIPAKKSNQPNLYAPFPGYNTHSGFHSKLSWDTNKSIRLILNHQFNALKGKKNETIVKEAAELFLEEIQHLTENTSADVIICAIPFSLLNIIDAQEETYEEDKNNPIASHGFKIDLHNLLKAKAMKLQKPIQLVLPATYDDSQTSNQKKLGLAQDRSIQDEATRAWNFYTAIYYKASGSPWRLVRNPSHLDSCYVGISFFNALDKSKVSTSMAQVFNERGVGVIIRGGTASISKEDRQPHLTNEGAFHLLNKALNSYKKEHYNLPARVVLHKSSSYNNEELEGFSKALKEQQISIYDFVSLSKGYTRLFRYGKYPPLRGTFLNGDDGYMLLYTRGSVPFFQTYPGRYPPRSLRINAQFTEQTPRFIAEEILGLTKMNWNNTQFDGFEPITLRAAKQVGNILKYLPDDDMNIQPHYKFYM